MNISLHPASPNLQITLNGQFTFNDHGAFREVLRYVENPEFSQFTVDLSSVSFVDSAALGMLLLARDMATKHQKTISLKGASGQVKKTLDIAKFNTLFTMI